MLLRTSVSFALAALLLLPEAALAQTGTFKPVEGLRSPDRVAPLPPPEDARDGYSIAQGPIDGEGLSAGETGTYIVAGCVPLNLKIDGVSGSTWVACNDLDYLKDKVEVTEVTSCLDEWDHGILDGFWIKEINNRTWESFRISCRRLKSDGTLGARREKQPFLFNFPREGKLYSTVLPNNRLAHGIFEVENALQLSQGLLQVALLYQWPAEHVHAGRVPRLVEDEMVTPRVPKASPLTVKTHAWRCPPGQVLTGAGIGHNPDRGGNDTKPIFILAECRVLIHKPVVN